MRLLVLALILMALLLSGCVSNPPTGQATLKPDSGATADDTPDVIKYVCPDGTVVSKPELCPSTNQQPAQPQPSQVATEQQCPYDCCVGDPDYYDKACASGYECINQICEKIATTIDAINCKVAQLTTSLKDERGARMDKDGAKIAYSVGMEQPEIWLMNSDGSGKEYITGGFRPCWHPTKNRIVYTQYYDIWVMDLDRNEKMRLTFDDYATNEDEACYSPDGTEIAFSSNEGISIMNSDGTNRRQIVTKGSHPMYSPDGRKIVYSMQEESSPFVLSVWAYDTVTKETKQIATGDAATGVTNGPSEAAYSPDADKIVYVDVGGLYIMSSEGDDKIHLITTEGTYHVDENPNWEYDAEIVYSSWVEGTGNIDGHTKGNSDVYKLDCSGKIEVSSPIEPPSPAKEMAKVSIVIDGDTVILENGEAVRLIGINASETGQKCYEEAKDMLEELVLGKDITLEKDESERDKYGRLLRYIYIGDVFVNVEMVRLGYATAYEYPPDTKYSNQISQAELEAKQGNGCLWYTPPTNYIEDQCIQITNFHFNASGNDNYNLNDEYVSFKNNCSYSIDMSGWSIKDAATNTYVFPSFRFEPNAAFTLYSGSGANTKTQLFWSRTDYAVWNNTGDTLYMRNSNGDLVLSYSYAGYG